MTANEAIAAGWVSAMADIAEGKSARAVCRARGWNWGDFWRMTLDEPRASQYARARESGWAAMAEDCLVVSDDGTNDTYVDDEGRAKTDHDVIARSRLRVDTRKWLLSKMLPKVYGEKQTHEVTGPGGGPLKLDMTPMLPQGDGE